MVVAAKVSLIILGACLLAVIVLFIGLVLLPRDPRRKRV